MRVSINQQLFLKSALARNNFKTPTDKVLTWLKLENERVQVVVNKILFNQLKDWKLNQNNLSHSSGKFFSIDAIKIHTNWGAINNWEQPIINQPEIGYLGFLTKEFNGILYFLVQAKIEPGNVNKVQLSPTLQATKSNYTQVHKGKVPAYLDYFKKALPKQIMIDQLQSEQGARFLKKRNRNIIIKVDEEIIVKDNFIWLTLSQIKCLMSLNNIVNMDTRTVISNIYFGSFDSDSINIMQLLYQNRSSNLINFKFLKSSLAADESLHTMTEIFSFVTSIKSFYDLTVTQIPITETTEWQITENEIMREDNKYFKVIAVDVQINNREVTNWSQPMIEPVSEGLCAFICKEIKGFIHFAVQIKLECGNFDIIEFAPTVQTLTGNYKDPDYEIPFLDYILNTKTLDIVYDGMQSEEGGRFYREQNRNMIVMSHDELDIALPDKFIWMTLNQLNTFIMHNNYVNIQARNILAQIQFD